MSKTIVIVGLTGNQGSSVAHAFLQDPTWKVRGITRDPSKPSAQQWTTKGVQVVRADLDDPTSLTAAFAGATAIFGVTDFMGLFADPDTHRRAAEQGRTPNEVAMDREVRQGKNIVDAAAATLGSLDRFVLSTLSETKKWSGGKITFNLHFDGKAAFAEYARERYPELWAKTSLLQMGVFAENWRMGMTVPKKVGEGVFKLQAPQSGERKFPLVDVEADTGSFVRALVASPPGQNFVGASAYLNWNEWCAIWARVHGVELSFERLPYEVLENSMGPLGREMADMFRYIEEFGYDGSDPSVVYPWDLEKKGGVHVPVTSVEDYIKRQDWSSVLNA
ncbi:NAD(P)-binding protein [Corynespora cassiicola Philippines]|uniref:NAD(P)-binding protein n=1 Tax=Corynespora cassiicola Philippines TaxID=1448308 RepID=A0A2T2P8D4_CORCC|nr:NAD(P)-binding protein [Corynespora cassiicola Philippines]